jgi:hypothetical protein
MPKNTKTVMIIVALTWLKMEPIVAALPPQKLSLKTPASKANTRMTRKTKIGTILAMVTIRLTTAAFFTPRVIKKWKV